MNFDLMDGERSAPRGSTGFAVLLGLFTLSGTAGLIYELVWFQLLRLTIGGSAQSLGVLLACFMGGLCLGSWLYARTARLNWHPLKTYALMEVGIAAFGLAMPVLLSWVSGIYFSHATTPTAAIAWRSLICIAALLPPTILMGATLPALARWLEADSRQSARIGRLYSANVAGAVAGVFAAALVLLPRYGLTGTNYVAVGLNLLVALIAFSIPGRFSCAREERFDFARSRDRTLIYIAYALSGMAALSFEVLWTRLMGSVLGATVYGFALVLGMFLLGLGIGGTIGSVIASRVASPRRTFALLQLAVVGCVGLTAWLVPFAADLLVTTDLDNVGNLLALSATNVLRCAIVVLPGALCWGMLFPVAVACLGGSLNDAAKPVGRLYAWNTIGAVLGSLATSFLLIPHHGSAMGAASLVILPLCAAAIIMWPSGWPAWPAILPALAAAAIAFTTGWLSGLGAVGRQWADLLGSDTTYLLLAALPAFLGFELYLVKRDPRRLIMGFAASGLAFAFSARVPARLYELGRQYGARNLVDAGDGEIVLFEEGTMEPVVVYHSLQGPLEVSINSFVCASTVPSAMEHLRLLGHLPALLSRDPRESLVIGLGAGVTAGCVAIHERVEHVQVIELEPKVKLAAAEFAEANHHVMKNPKINVRIDDGRHFIATTDRKFGVITSDPIEPFWAGSAALYTLEHYQRCRAHLNEGGVFCQWLGIYGLDEESIRSLLAAFAQAFPEGSVWATPTEMIFIGSTAPMRFDIEVLRQRLKADPAVSESLASVGVRSIEELFGRYVCPVRTLKGYLAGAEPNRDRMLTVQYTGWQAFYQPERWRDRIRQMLADHHDLDVSDFVMTATDGPRFLKRVNEEWQEFLEPSRWPGPVPPEAQPGTSKSAG